MISNAQDCIVYTVIYRNEGNYMLIHILHKDTASYLKFSWYNTSKYEIMGWQWILRQVLYRVNRSQFRKEYEIATAHDRTR